MNRHSENQKLDLTVRQKEALEFVRKFILERGYGPTVRELAEGLGIHSPNGAKSHLDALERKGFISREANLARSIILADSNGASQTDGQVLVLLENGVLSYNPDSSEKVNLEEKLKINKREFCWIRVVNECFLCGVQFQKGDLLLIRRSRNAAEGETVILRNPEDGFILAKCGFSEELNKTVLKTSSKSFLNSFSSVWGILIALIRFEFQGINDSGNTGKH